MLNQVLEKIDEKVLTDDLKTSLVEAFDKAVDEKAQSLSKDLLEAKEKEYNETLYEMIETVSKTIALENQEKFDVAVEAKATSISESKVQELKEEYEAKAKEDLELLESNMKKYLEFAVQEFVDESLPAWKDEVEVTKANKIMEEFAVLAESYGVKLSAITNEDSKVDESKALDEAVNKVAELRKQIDDFKKESMIKEAKEGLSVIKQDKLDTLLESVEFKSEKDFKNKIDLYVSALSESSEKEKKLDESKKPTDKKVSWRD